MKERPAFATELSNCIQLLHSLGHSPATSTNYSFIDDQNNCWVSRSGIDKSACFPTDFIQVDKNGLPLASFKDTPASAETGIHCALYELFPNTKVILHSHDLYPVLFCHGKASVSFDGFELQKGFPGVQTHLINVTIPVIQNSQDMEDIKQQLIERKDELGFQVFMIEKHGFYSWGTSLFEAKRILETFSYLCKTSWYLTH